MLEGTLFSTEMDSVLSLARLPPQELSCRLELPNSGAQQRSQPEVWLQVVQKIGE